MRPPVLFPLFADLTTLRGLGARTAKLYEKLCGGTQIVDLLWHIPVGLVDRRYAPQLRRAEKGRVATLTLTVLEHEPPDKASRPYKIYATDGTDPITITYFNVKGDYLDKLYPPNAQVVVSGLLDRFNGWTMGHPDYVVPRDRAAEIPAIEPVYPLTAGLSGKGVRKAIQAALARAPDLPEWHDPSLMTREGWPTWREALAQTHDPAPHPDPGVATWAEPTHRARQRLAYDEILADQLALAIIRRHHKSLEGRALIGTNALRAKLDETLPFKLTQGQQQACREIASDMESNNRMLRLLQGDVGSGKTIVALFSMLHAVEAGTQAALMAPTEILAKQHHERLTNFLAPLGLDVGLLVGKTKSAERKKILAQLEDGSLPLVVGTHALFQQDVAFKDLGLAIVDEQHRFGVQQRLKLSEKGRGVDILVMTATPIPRTLTLTAYGDMDVSRLAEKPAGRQPIDTRLIDASRIDEVVAGLGRQMSKGMQAYWVCPLVEESEKSDLAAATARAEELRAHFGADSVGLVHGRLAPEEKDRVMAAFKQGEIKLLVATTVIEVGVDVPNANLMVVEHAERFGLAALHQLRGRIGRGSNKATCLLMYHPPLSEIARARLTMMRETEDGFQIAEEDLRLRGPGELLGTRQSGLLAYRLASPEMHKDLIPMAHDDAALILHRDPDLKTPRGQSLRTLLYLFQKDSAVRLFRA